MYAQVNTIDIQITDQIRLVVTLDDTGNMLYSSKEHSICLHNNITVSTDYTCI